MAALLLWLAFATPCELLVAAASDLAPTRTGLSAAFEKLSGCRLRFNFGSSGMLARQIENGAPFDVYLSANKSLVSDLVRLGKVKPTVATYAFGRLGLWSKRGIGWSDLGKVRHISLANPQHAPYGKAAREALESQGVWKELESKIVYAENVSQAFQFAESGNADVVITAWSLVKDRKGQLVDNSWHKPIEQAGAVVANSTRQDLAVKFLRFLGSKEGRAILVAHGLTPPN